MNTTLSQRDRKACGVLRKHAEAHGGLIYNPARVIKIGMKLEDGVVASDIMGRLIDRGVLKWVGVKVYRFTPAVESSDEIIRQEDDGGDANGIEENLLDLSAFDLAVERSTPPLEVLAEIMSEQDGEPPEEEATLGLIELGSTHTEIPQPIPRVSPMVPETDRIRELEEKIRQLEEEKFLIDKERKRYKNKNCDLKNKVRSLETRVQVLEAYLATDRDRAEVARLFSMVMHLKKEEKEKK